MADRRSYLLRSVSNAARVLKSFSHDSTSLGVSEISERLGIAKSTAHRLLATLADEGLLVREPNSTKYRLGLKLYELGQRAVSSLEIHDVVPEVLDRLKDRTGETAHVAVLDGREVVYIARRESDRSLRMFQSVGHRNWAHCTATGKLLLAYLEPEEVRALLPKQLEEMTALTITDREVLIKRLGPIRRRGYAENVSEVEPGVASAAAPIWSHENKVVAAIGAAGPVSRIDEHFSQELVDAVIEAGREASIRMGSSEELQPKSELTKASHP